MTTVILSADVQGYSRMMGEDEYYTIRTLTAYRELMSTLIQKHRGRVVDFLGDNLLAEAVLWMRCSVLWRHNRYSKTRTMNYLKMHRMQFRIGVSLGDVIDERRLTYEDSPIKRRRNCRVALQASELRSQHLTVGFFLTQKSISNRFSQKKAFSNHHTSETTWARAFW